MGFPKRTSTKKALLFFAQTVDTLPTCTPTEYLIA